MKLSLFLLIGELEKALARVAFCQLDDRTQVLACAILESVDGRAAAARTHRTIEAIVCLGWREGRGVRYETVQKP